jgi:hypothetical protein
MDAHERHEHRQHHELAEKLSNGVPLTAYTL